MGSTPLSTRMLLVGAAAALVACGHGSGDEAIMDGLAQRCEAQAGAAYSSAWSALRGGYSVGPQCSTELAAMPAADACGPASPERPICQVLIHWFSEDPAACAGGQCTCELRLVEAELRAGGEQAVVCGARFLRGREAP